MHRKLNKNVDGVYDIIRTRREYNMTYATTDNDTTIATQTGPVVRLNDDWRRWRTTEKHTQQAASAATSLLRDRGWDGPRKTVNSAAIFKW